MSALTIALYRPFQNVLCIRSSYTPGKTCYLDPLISPACLTLSGPTLWAGPHCTSHPAPYPITHGSCSFFRPRIRCGLSGEVFPELLTDTCFQSTAFFPITIYVHLLTVRLLEVGTMSNSSSFSRFLFHHPICLTQTTNCLQTRMDAWTTLWPWSVNLWWL